MNDKTKLKLSMFSLFLITFVFFGVIVVNIKMGSVLIPKIDKKLNNYINSEYKDIKDELKIEKTKYNQVKGTYQVKVKNKTNKKLYFTVTYNKKDITSTYQKDYVEGKTILTYLKTKYEQELNKSKKYQNQTITFKRKLNKYTGNVKEKIINNDNIKDLPIYNLSTEIYINKWDQQVLNNEITKYYKYVTKLNYNPKEYEILISNNNNVEQSVKISKLTNNLIINNTTEIINGIINNDKTIIQKYNINYQYMN